MDSATPIKEEQHIMQNYVEQNELAILTFKESVELYNVCLSTRKIISLKVPHMSIRPQMHILIVGLPGCGKSTILYDSCTALKTTPFPNFSTSVLLGSVDKESKQLMMPVTYAQRNSILGFDEVTFIKDRTGAMYTLISLLEQMEYRRPFPYKCFDKKRYEDDGTHFFVDEDNYINVKSRFCCVMTTMSNMFYHKASTLKTAVKGRFLLLPIFPSSDELAQMSQGKLTYRFKDYNVPRRCTINRPTYRRLCGYVNDFLHRGALEPSLYLRTIGDICRLYSVVGFNKRIFDMHMRVRCFKSKEYS